MRGKRIPDDGCRIPDTGCRAPDSLPFYRQPLAFAKRHLDAALRKTKRVPFVRDFIYIQYVAICRLQRSLDSSFDRRFGTDTAGMIPLQKLNVSGDTVADGIWYEPMPVRVFRQMMDSLAMDVKDFTFVDFGSGKGRVLLLAAEQGFPHIIGVEFAETLHRTAERNRDRYLRKTGSPVRIDPVCMDAVDFDIPDKPLLLFFYSPFKRQVMQTVLRHVVASHAANPRPILIVFYGQFPDTIRMLRETGFYESELDLRPDWTRFEHYRGFIFSSVGSALRRSACASPITV